MKPVCTAAQVRQADAAVIDGLGVPGAALMETASRGLAQAIRDHHDADARRGVVVLCGPGNNGGDGYGAARWLKGWGYPVATRSLTDTSRGDALLMRQAARRAGVPEVQTLNGAGVVVDALFGTGLARPLVGTAADWLTEAASHPAVVVAADLPTGLHADTGAILGTVAPAATTVTFGRRKLGLYGEPGSGLIGRLVVVDIGLDAAQPPHAAELLEAQDVAPCWPQRGGADHKRSSGHLLVLAGSAQMAGAAVLCCLGALAGGVGLVTLGAPRGAIPRLGGLPPEVMVLPMGQGDLLEPPSGDLDGFTAICAGPGLGGGQGVPAPLEAWLRARWIHDAGPLLFDADALPFSNAAGTGPRVITPHPGEAGRLLGRSSSAVQADRFDAVRSLTRHGAVALLKGRHTLIAEPDGAMSINPTGGPVLASGGTGDVLAGLVGALLARGVDAAAAARLAAWVHGAAGDHLASTCSVGWTASDVAAAIPSAVHALLGR